MAEDDREEQDDLQSRFPEVPPAPHIPEPPKMTQPLPPHPAKPRPGAVEPGGYNKLALATTAASSFIMPIIVLSVGGWWLDQKLHHTTFWIAFIGVMLGMVVGVSALLNVVKRMQ
ncbi:MAG: hypothetical protein JWL77_5975 [Chthonomonadaceae bacterium]|nr:hypothetical protein [Chthonomonadaceae bacterium]